MIKTGQKDEALTIYQDVLADLDESSPLYPLVTLSLAQGQEINGNYTEAAAEFEKVKNIEGYQDAGYFGLARISEVQGDNQKALEIYEEYLTTLMNVAEMNQKSLVEEKIARLRAVL